MKEARIHNNQTLIADNQPAEITQPGEGPLDFPAMLSVSLLSLVTLVLYLCAAIVLWRPFMQADKSGETASQRGLASNPASLQRF